MNLKSGTEQIKNNAYKVMIRTNIEYNSNVWNPHHKQIFSRLTNINVKKPLSQPPDFSDRLALQQYLFVVVSNHKLAN